MANVLKMADQAAIIGLWRRGCSQRRIAREMGIHRETVGRYVRLARAGLVPGAPAWDSAKPANSTAGWGRQSLYEPFREIIEGRVDAGLGAQRIWQDLVGEHGFDGGYQSVKRFCRRIRATLPLPFRRMECDPGAEAQVDFGTEAPVVIPDGQPLPVTHGAYRLRTIRELLKRQEDRQDQFAFIQEHPIIRSLSDYDALVHTAFTKEPWS